MNELTIQAYLKGYMHKTAGDNVVEASKNADMAARANNAAYTPVRNGGQNIPEPKIDQSAAKKDVATAQTREEAKTKDSELMQKLKELRTKKLPPKPMQKTSSVMPPPQPQVDPSQLPGQGMGPGMQAQGAGFPMNADQATAQATAGGPDQQAMIEEQQQQQAKEEELKELEKMKEDTAHEAQKQKMTNDIYKNQVAIQKSQEEMEQAEVERQNETALAGMIGTSSPGKE